MTNLNIACWRLHNQFISRPTYETPEAVVRWLGAVQAQDYAAAKWAIGLRSRGVNDDAVEQAFTDGTILRTHVMRPTWHFVLPADIRWLLALTAPRVRATSAYYIRQLELDDAILARSNAVLAKALQGGKQLTREELVSTLRQAGITVDNADNTQRFTYIIMNAELDGVICSGARRGKQFTYALLDERVPPTRTLERDEALAELAVRYFTSHGPATVQDFVWWSGLTVADAQAALALATPQLLREVVDGQTYWFAPSTLSAQETNQVYLLPNYDEYIVGYTDRKAIFDESHDKRLDVRGNVLFNYTIVLDGRIVGTWKRTIQKATVMLTPKFFIPLDEAETRAFVESAKRYGDFLTMPVNITVED